MALHGAREQAQAGAERSQDEADHLTHQILFLKGLIG